MPQVLTNNDSTCVPVDVFPFSNEYGHWAAAKLTPTSYPFSVSKVRYSLNIGGPCVDMAHVVDVFVSPSATPPSSPTVTESFNVPTGSLVNGSIELTLANTLTLQSGDNLYVAVQLNGAGTQRMCIWACQGPAFKTQHNFWSNAVAPPFPWATLESFNLFDNYQIEALSL